MSAISEVNNFISRKACIPTKIIVVTAKVRNPVPIKIKEEPDRLIRPKSINSVKGYMQCPGVEFTESLLTVTLDTSTRILIGLT